MRAQLKILSFFLVPLLLVFSTISGAQVIDRAPPAQLTESNTTTQVLRNFTDLEQMLAQGPNPLDQLTPYSREKILRNVEWRDGQVIRFDFAVPIEELERDQAFQVYKLFGVERFFPQNFPIGAPLRYENVSPDYASLIESLRKSLDQDTAREKDENSTVVWRETESFYRTQLSALLQPSTLASTSKGNLLLLFKIVDEVNLMTASSRAFSDLKRLHLVLNQRGIDTRRSLDERLLKHMLVQRDLDAARALVASRPHLSNVAIPKLNEEGNFKTSDLSLMVEKRGQLYRQAMPTVKGKIQVLLLVSENCGFCRKLFADLERDRQLYARFSEAQMILISSLENGLPMNFVRAWNEKNPSIPMYMPGKDEQWKTIDVGGWPQFVFLKNGKVQERLYGWRNDGSSKNVIVSAIEKAGL